MSTSKQPSGPKHKYKRLYDLGADRLGIIDSMLMDGISTMLITERIQNEWGECTEVKVTTLDKQIMRYRDNIVEPKLKLAAERADNEGIMIGKAMKKFRGTVDVIQEMEEAINMQRSRIQTAYMREVRKGNEAKLDPSINKELRALTDMCRVLVGVQLETGIVRRVPKQIQGFFQNLDTNELQEFRLEMTQNDETLKAMGEIKGILEEAEAEAGEIIDGEYTPVEPSGPVLQIEDAEPVGAEED